MEEYIMENAYLHQLHKFHLEQYTEYLSNIIDNSMNFAEYLKENETTQQKAERKRNERKKKIERIFI
jgi:hypothetical protein